MVLNSLLGKRTIQHTLVHQLSGKDKVFHGLLYQYIEDIDAGIDIEFRFLRILILILILRLEKILVLILILILIVFQGQY